MSMQQPRKNKLQKVNEIMTGLKNAVNTKRYYDNLKTFKGIMDNQSMTTPSLQGATVNNVMQPTQSALAQTTPTLQNGMTSLAGDFASHTLPTSINSVGAGTGLGTLGSTSALNAGAGLGSSVGNLGTIGTAVASEASGAGGMGLAGLGNIGANIATTAGGEALAGAGTGAGAALGGTTAAGAAGGLGAAGAALGALAPVGAVAGLGLMIYNMINAEKEKKNQKAMSMSQQAAAKTEGDAEQTTQQSMNKLQQDANEKKMQLINDVTQNMQPQGVYGDLYNSVSNPALKDMALNNQISQQPTEQVPVQGSAASNIADGLNTASNSAGLISDIAGMVNGDIPITPTNTTPQTPLSTVSDAPDLTQEVIPSKFDAYANPQFSLPTDASVIGVNPVGRDATNTFNYLDPSFQAEKPTSTADALGTTNINEDGNVPHLYNEDNISPTIQQETVNTAPTADAKEGLKGRLFENVKNGLQNFASGYKDNSENGIIDGDLLNGRTGQKTFGQRLGEVVGTGARVLRNPYVQGGIAGALYAKDKGDALYGLGKGWEWAQNRAKNNAYIDALRKAGIDVPNGVLGGVGATDAAALAKVAQTPYMNMYYRGRALQGLAASGLKPDGTPYTARDIKLMRKLYNGEDIDDNTVINPYYKTEVSTGNKNKDVEISKNNMETAGIYSQSSDKKIKAAQIDNATAKQYEKNKTIPQKTVLEVVHPDENNPPKKPTDSSQPNNNSNALSNNKKPNLFTRGVNKLNNQLKQNALKRKAEKQKNKVSYGITTNGTQYTYRTV